MVVVIGAGLTGLGVARDLALRGISVTVVDQGGLVFGTSGRFHGLLHSGGRYAVTDPATAKECWQENQILRKVAPDALELTGGLFVRLSHEDSSYEQQWLAQCQTIGLPVKAWAPRDIPAQEPDLTPHIGAAYLVPDAVVNSFKLAQLLETDIARLGSIVLHHHQVLAVSLLPSGDKAVSVAGPSGHGEIIADAVVNATGPWAEEVARLMGVSFALQLHRGTMIVFAHRRVQHVINHLASPGDGDIMVPHQAVMLFGTTDVAQAGPDSPAPPPDEILHLMRLGADLFPGIEHYRVLRAFTGVRPLYDPGHTRGQTPLSRNFTLLAHEEMGGMPGTYTLTSGKLTTYRIMAEHAADAVTRYIGVGNRPCRTAEVPLTPGVRPTPTLPATSPLDASPIICECEAVSQSTLDHLSDRSLLEWRLLTWLSMGPCQGTFCIHRAEALRARQVGVTQAAVEASELRQERWRGWQNVGWGVNLREIYLQRALTMSTLDGPDPYAESRL